MNSLTSREREIVRTLASGGLSNKDVSRRLNLSEGTVKVHLHNIYQKLGVKTRTALVVLAHSFPTREDEDASDFVEVGAGIAVDDVCLQLVGF
jgi:two-component system, NarL family, nitrate/nitrite response regulator NarL